MCIRDSAYTGQTRGAQARPFVLGLATAAILLIKISDIPGLGVMVPVSYTHLDVYKRQALTRATRFGRPT